MNVYIIYTDFNVITKLFVSQTEYILLRFLCKLILNYINKFGEVDVMISQ